MSRVLIELKTDRGPIPERKERWMKEARTLVTNGVVTNANAFLIGVGRFKGDVEPGKLSQLRTHPFVDKVTIVPVERKEDPQVPLVPAA